MNPVIEAPNRPSAFVEEKLWALVACFIAFVLLDIWIRIDASAHLSRILRARRRSPGKEDALPTEEWEDLFRRAERVVEDTIATLPDEIRAQAVALPCLYRQWAQELRGEEALGIYHGFRPGVLSQEGGWIVLFLGDLQKACSEHELDFEDEVRTTYLHELGHHLGWDEADLESRGLG